MKTYLTLMAAVICLSACHHQSQQNENLKLAQVRFAPPVIKADKEVSNQIADVHEKETVGNGDAEIGYDAPAASQTRTIVKDTAKKIIKEGDITFQTKNLVRTRKGIINEVQKLGGYIADDSQRIDSGENRKQYELKVRIPAKYFDLFVDSVSAGAIKIDSKHITVTDATSQYIDMATRLQNKRVLEARYLELLKKASKISDMLAIENKVNDIQADIDSEQGQLNYMSKQVAFSSLDITFYTQNILQPNGQSGFGSRIGNALASGFEGIKDIAIGLIAIWPVWVVLGGLFFFVMRYFKSQKERKVVTVSHL